MHVVYTIGMKEHLSTDPNYLSLQALIVLFVFVFGCRQTESVASLDAGIPLPVDIDASFSMDFSIDASAMVLSACIASDLDGDSFGTHPSCPQIDCDDEYPSIHPSSSEACNGKDDDCDGQIDEDLPDSICGVGQCRRRQPCCVSGELQACLSGLPSHEQCNDLDDDCDGIVDELVLLESCGVGQCLQTEFCNSGILMACLPLEPTEETCDRVDNDCDGRTDEGFGANMHRTQYDALSVIMPGCTGLGWSGLSGADCDTAFHRYCAELDCHKTGYGPAEQSNGSAWVTCLNDASLVTTSYNRLSELHAPCAADGERQGMNCNAAISRFCRAEGYVSGFGPVEQEGTVAVVSCVGLPAHHHSTTYTQLSTFHTPCDGTQRIGPNCNAAIKRYCVSIGYRSGFGPNENFGDNVTVTCVP